MDGALIAEDVTVLNTRLFPGVHTIRVENPYGLTISKDVRIAKTGAVPELFFHVKPKPAQLVIQSNVDADIRLDGTRVGRSWTSEVNPIVVPLDSDWRGQATYQIELTKDGYAPSQVQGTFRAGTKTVLKVNLVSEPKTNGAPLKSQGYRYKTTLDQLGL